MYMYKSVTDDTQKPSDLGSVTDSSVNQASLKLRTCICGLGARIICTVSNGYCIRGSTSPMTLLKITKLERGR